MKNNDESFLVFIQLGRESIWTFLIEKLEEGRPLAIVLAILSETESKLLAFRRMDSGKSIISENWKKQICILIKGNVKLVNSRAYWAATIPERKGGENLGSTHSWCTKSSREHGTREGEYATCLYECTDLFLNMAVSSFCVWQFPSWEIQMKNHPYSCSVNGTIGTCSSDELLAGSISMRFLWLSPSETCRKRVQETLR